MTRITCTTSPASTSIQSWTGQALVGHFFGRLEYENHLKISAVCGRSSHHTFVILDRLRVRVFGSANNMFGFVGINVVLGNMIAIRVVPGEDHQFTIYRICGVSSARSDENREGIKGRGRAGGRAACSAGSVGG